MVTLERPTFGRKRSMCGFLLLSGLCLCLHPIIGDTHPNFKIALSIFGRFCANCSYTILNLFSAEQFPTVVRGVGVGYTLVISRIGNPNICFFQPSGSTLSSAFTASSGAHANYHSK